MQSGLINLYKNEIPINEILAGASIAIAALFLIIPGFFTDAIGFLLLIPFTRKFLISVFIKKRNLNQKNNDDVMDGEIIEDKKDEL